jgi:photosystem II stability/assembly factor-like uncharacterized protein
MLRSGLFIILVVVTGASVIGSALQVKSNSGSGTQLPQLDPIAESTSGISFGSLADDGAGGLWVGGSVFGIQGLLLKSRARIPMAQTISKAKFIFDLSFYRRKGWIIADGLLYHTSNVDGSWQAMSSPGLETGLKTVCFVDERFGWVAGRQGFTASTTDGGDTWQKQNIGTEFTIERIRFVSRHNGWAMAVSISPPETRRILLLTSDGGVTWKKARESDRQQFRSVTFVNPRLGWAINSRSDILQTVDAGETWKVQRIADGASWNSIFFLNESEGWAAGNGVVHSSDGGKTWVYQLKTNGTGEDALDEIMFAGPGNGIVIGLTRILVTRNFGGSWKPLSNLWKSAVISKIRREKFKSVKKRTAVRPALKIAS